MSERNNSSSVHDTIYDELSDMLNAARVDYVDCPIHTETLPFVIDPLSPTPLDPYTLRTSGAEYYGSALMLMNGRLDDTAQKSGLSSDSPAYMATAAEIETQHSLRSMKNSESLDRLRLEIFQRRTLGVEISKESQERILRARAATATMVDHIRLLEEFPQMEAIEAMKATFPLDMKAYTNAMKTFTGRLVSFQYTMPELNMRSPCEDDAKPRYKDLSGSADDSVIVLKNVLKDLTYRGTDMQLVQRRSFIVLPTSLQLRKVTQNIIQLPNSSSAVNLQPIDTTAYLRVRGNESSSLTKDELEAKAVADSAGLYFAKGSLSEHLRR